MTALELFDFIKNSPSVFHSVKSITDILTKNGFVQLKEEEKWKLNENSVRKFFIVRNNSSVISFVLPKNRSTYKGFLITSSHSDSPCFKIKENPEIKAEGCVKLNVEKYGGMLLAPWFDRPLSVAGRIFVRSNDDEASSKSGSTISGSAAAAASRDTSAVSSAAPAGDITQILVNLDRDLLLIPSLAIHMNRDANKGSEISVQNEMCPVFSEDKDANLLRLVAEAAGVKENQIIGSDLYLYNRTAPALWGADQEFISSPKLDDLECAFTTLKGFLQSENSDYVTVHAVFDNEEVGSLTRQGADSTFLSDVLHRINLSLGRSQEDYFTSIAQSFMLSADNAHAAHPNYTAKADPVNRPHMNGGPVLKFNAAQKYTTDGLSAAMFKEVCRKSEVPVQVFTNNSDIAGGSTLGNLSNAHVSLRCADIGLAQLAMHSPYETAGTKDLDYMIKAIAEFYRQ